MPYTDDKRIRDLQTQVALLLSDFIPMDRTGSIEATKVTVQQIVNLVSPNITKQIATAGNGTPDNAAGNNGDLYFQIPADGSFIRLYQKTGLYWFTVFNLPINGITEIEFDNSDVDTDGNITYSVPSGKTIMGVDIAQVVSSLPVRKNLFPEYNADKVYGFEKLTGVDTQTITIKIG